MKGKAASIGFLSLALLMSGCVTSKIETLSSFTPDPSRPPVFDKEAVEEYYFQGWEPYLYVITLGIVPQYHYVVVEKQNGVFEKRSEMFGWVAIPLPIFTSWNYGGLPARGEAQQAAGGDAPR